MLDAKDAKLNKTYSINLRGKLIGIVIIIDATIIPQKRNAYIRFWDVKTNKLVWGN